MSTRRRTGRKAKAVRIKMNGSVDWSDDEAVKSGSATGFSDHETDERPSSKVFRNKYDPVTSVLDKIDAELSSLSRSQSSNETGSTVVHRNDNNGSRSNSSNQEDLTTNHLEKSGSSSRSLPSLEINGNRQQNGHLDSRHLRHITGTVEMYKEPKKNGDSRLQHGSAPSDLDSETAHQVDEKFKEILQKKKGGYLHNLRASYPQSDADTIQTEDFERRFQNAMVYNSDDSGTLEASFSDRGLDSDDPDYQENPETIPGTKNNLDNSPNQGRPETIKEEAELPQRTSIPLQSKTVGSITPQSFHPSESDSKLRKRRHPRQICASDAESIRTEDFEIRFQDLLVRPADKGLDPGTDSELNDPLHRKVKEILQLSSPYGNKLNGLTIQGVHDDKTKDSNSRRQNYERSHQRGAQANLTDDTIGRSSERRSLQKNFDRRQHHDHQRGADVTNEHTVRGRDTERDRRTQSMSPRRDKSPTHTAMKMSSRSTSFEDLSLTSLPPGCPPPIMGRLSPYHSPERSSPIPEQQGLYSRDRSRSPSRSKSPFEQSRNFAERNHETQDRSGQRPMSSDRPMSPSRSDQPMELPPSPEIQAYERSKNSRDRTERKSLERSRSPHEHVQNDPANSMSRSQDSRQEHMSQGNYSVHEKIEKPHRPSSGFERPRFSSSLYGSAERLGRPRTMSDQPVFSPSLPVQGHRSISPIFNGRGSPRSSDLSVSFQEDFPDHSNDRYTDGRKSPSHLDLAYCKSKPQKYTEVKAKANKEETEPKTLRGVNIDLRTAQKQLKEVKALMEDARTQLMLTEFKRDNTMKDLERMKEDLLRKKRQLMGCEDQLRFRQGEMRETTNMDDQTEALVQENESLKHRLRQVDGLELERDELVRQLELAKEDLFNEQKHARNRIEELKDEVENLTAQMEETKSPQSELLERIKILEQQNSKLMADKEQVTQETTKRWSRGEFEKCYGREVEKLRVESDELLSKLRKVQNEANTSANENKILRERIHDLEEKFKQERSGKDGLMGDHKRSLQSLRKEMDTAMVQLRENLFLDKQNALEELRQSLEKTRRTESTKSEDKLLQTMTEHKGVVKKKDEEIAGLLDLIKKLETERDLITKSVQYEVQQKVEEALNEEKQKLMADREWTVRREREQMQQESRLHFKDMANELEHEKKQKERLTEQINQTNKELEDQRLQNKQAVHEKMVAVARAKEQVRHEMLSEFDKVKEKLKQEHRQELYRLQDTIRKQEDELCQLRAERKLFLRPELENTMDRVERTIVNELNEEVRRNAGIIGIPAKKIDPRNFSLENDGYTASGRSRTPTTAALSTSSGDYNDKSNLRSCNQELRSHVQQLKKELELQKTALIRAEREKEDVAKNVKIQLEREKNKELDKLKEKMIQMPAHEHMNGVAHHKPSNMTMHYTNGHMPHTTYQFNPSGTVQRQEIERLEREIRKLAENQKRALTMPKRNSFDDIQAEKMVNQLAAKVSQLQQENNSLRLSKHNSVSVPDLSSPVHYRSALSPYRPTQQEKLVNHLEQRSREALLDSDTAAEHQQMNRNMMSQKMYEMTKLQNSLTDQAKELIHLGQSYQQLNNRCSPTRELNMTR